VAIAALMLCALAPGAAGAQERLPDPKVHPLQVPGPPSQRLNLIIMGDGYQKDQQSLFFTDVDRNLSVMWATEPFRSYRNWINVYALELASIDYGVRCDPDGRVRAADGTVGDSGVREGPIDGKRTAVRPSTARPTRSTTRRALGHSLGTMADEYPYNSRDVVRRAPVVADVRSGGG
jgi:hypothetical protein